MKLDHQFALLHSDSGFSFTLGAVGVIVIVALVVLISLAPLFDWMPDLMYWLVKRRKRTDDSGEPLSSPLPRQRSSPHDENA